VCASSLIEDVRCRLGAADVPAEVVSGGSSAVVSLRQVLAARLSDPRKRRGVRHSLASLVSVLIAGVACGYASVLAIAGAAAGWDGQVLAAHGTRRHPVTGAFDPPSAATLGRLPALVDAEELEAALSEWIAGPALAAPVFGEQQRPAPRTRRRRPAAAQALGEVRSDGWCRAAPGHPWLDRGVLGDPGHRAGVRAVAVDGKDRKRAKTGGARKVHLLGAVVHHNGAVIAQTRVDSKANEITHFKPLLDRLPITGVAVTTDAMQTTREHARWLVEDKHAHYLFPVLGNQPGLYARLDALPWATTPVHAATTEITRGRIETRTLRVLPAPPDLDFPHAGQAVLIERYITIKKNRRWVMRNCEAVLYLTSLDSTQADPADLLALIRGHWSIEHLHWLRDVIWDEDKSTLRAGNAPQVMSALTNLVITLFRLQGVTKIKAETRRNAQDPHRTIHLLDLRPG
jgi:predicted transposase YbfD/YdcC